MELLMGNEAIVKAALKAGVKFYSAYPITPASEITQAVATCKEIKSIQAEDEIAAINMCIGASLAGAKTFTATSGPGFSLKQESIGLAFKVEAPLVIVDSQRVGPSTGMPTLPSQGDILQAMHGTHGDYVSMAFYPNSVEEAYKYFIETINAAEESLGPVIFLMDGYISQMYETADLESIKFSLKQRDKKPLGEGKRHFTGLTTKNGLLATKDPQAYRAWWAERKKKILDTAKKYEYYEYIENKDSDTLLVAYGITSRVILPLKEQHSIFRPIRMFPVVEDIKEIAKKYKRIVVVEMNDGQYKHELEAFLKRDIEGISQLGGKISLKEIQDGLGIR